MRLELTPKHLVRLAERKLGRKLTTAEKKSITDEKNPGKKGKALKDLVPDLNSQDLESWRQAMTEEERLLAKIADGTAVIDPNANPDK